MKKYNSSFEREYPGNESVVYDISNKIYRMKLLPTPNEARTCTYLKWATNLMVSPILISWFEAEFRQGSGAGDFYILRDWWRNDQSTKFGPVMVSNVETTGCSEE